MTEGSGFVPFGSEPTTFLYQTVFLPANLIPTRLPYANTILRLRKYAAGPNPPDRMCTIAFHPFSTADTRRAGVPFFSWFRFITNLSTGSTESDAVICAWPF